MPNLWDAARVGKQSWKIYVVVLFHSVSRDTVTTWFIIWALCGEIWCREKTELETPCGRDSPVTDSILSQNCCKLCRESSRIWMILFMIMNGGENARLRQFSALTWQNPLNVASTLRLGITYISRLLCMSCIIEEDTVDAGVCYLDHICVDSDFRGKGIGKVLMERAEYEALKNSCHVSVQGCLFWFCVFVCVRSIFPELYFSLAYANPPWI